MQDVLLLVLQFKIAKMSMFFFPWNAGNIIKRLDPSSRCSGNGAKPNNIGKFSRVEFF